MLLTNGELDHNSCVSSGQHHRCELWYSERAFANKPINNERITRYEKTCIIRSAAPDSSTFGRTYRLFFFRHKGIRIPEGGDLRDQR